MESVAIHYVEGAPNASIIAVSHAEQLSLSRCVQASADRLWCGTWHNPHPAAKSERTAELRQICTSCHPAVTLAANHASPQTSDCVACHMPRRPTTDVAHAAITDHRIVRRPGNVAPLAEPRIVNWKLDDSPSAPRNSALAWFAYAQKTKNTAVAKEAYRRLESLPQAMRDAAVAAASGYMLLQFGQTKLAVAAFDEAARKEPANAEYWLDLAVAQDAAGVAPAALNSLQKAISLDEYDYRPYLAAAKTYDRIGVAGQARMIQRYLLLDPQSLTMRLAE